MLRTRDICCETFMCLSSIDGFEETAQYKLFRILDIPLYHCWVLNLEEQAPTFDAIDGRSYDKLNVDRIKYMSTKTADKPTEVIDGARNNIMDYKYDLISKLFQDNSGQMTGYGLHMLKKHTQDGQLFILFQNEHFSIIYKRNRALFRLITDVGYQTCWETWQVFDNLLGDGPFLEDVLAPVDQMLSAPKASYDSGTTKHVVTQPRHDKQSQQHRLNLPFESSYSKWCNNKASQRDSSSRKILSSSSSSSRLGTRHLSPDSVKVQFASFFTEQSDGQLERKFLDFLRGYKENNALYYGQIVEAMKVLGSSDMRVFYDHIQRFDPKLADLVCRCYARVRNNLNHAALTFIRDLKIGFHCENPVVSIYKMPQLESWIPVQAYFRMEGNHPAEARDIYCGNSFLRVTDTTQIGRIVLTNALVTLSKNHMEGKSWNGQWTLDELWVNDKLEVTISAQFCDRTTRMSKQADFERLANDLLPVYKVNDKMPGFFRNLDQSLRSYIDNLSYGSAMLRKFHDFITAHPALKPSLTRLAFIDNLYSVHQSLSRTAKKLLQSILNSVPLMNDWRLKFEDNPEVVNPATPIHKIVYQYHQKEASNDRKDSKEGKGDGSEPSTGHGDNFEVVIYQPFAGTAEGGLIYLRHVRHHGTKGSMDAMGRQLLKRLSELDLVNAHVFDIVLPAVLERLTYNIDDFRTEYSEEVYEELLGWLEDILEQYRRPEFPSSV